MLSRIIFTLAMPALMVFGLLPYPPEAFLPVIFLSALFRCNLGLDDLDLTAVIGTALRAHSVALVKSAALRARNKRGSGELPMRRTSLIASLTGYFPLRYCHGDTSLKLSCCAAMFMVLKALRGFEGAGQFPFCSDTSQN